ncbi:MAG: cupin domain-containing protein [Thermodesulfovibrionales bacterium]
MQKRWLLFTLPFLVLFMTVVAGVSAERGKMARGSEGKIILTPDALQWKAGPSSLPTSQVAVLEGDPKKQGFFVMRIKLPAGTKIPPHVHKNRERVTIISGKFNLAMGEKTENPISLPAGSYFSFQPNTVHNAWVDEETVVQIGTMGPWSYEPTKR